jgi:excisionase family DNA binding protein
VGEDRTDAHSVSRDGDRLTIAEASTLLGVHKNTVRNRIKDGTYRAEKVITERGQTYLIERKSLLTNLTTNTLSSDSQQLVSPAPMEFVQELLRPFVNELGDVREELGAERARRQMAEERAANLEAENRALREARESPQNPGPTETTTAAAGVEAQEAAKSAHSPTLRPQGDEATGRPWWQRIFGGR